MLPKTLTGFPAGCRFKALHGKHLRQQGSHRVWAGRGALF